MATPEGAVLDAWERLERWFRRHHPDVLAALRPGAPAEAVDALEQLIGRDLPSDVRASFAAHDGQHPGTGAAVVGLRLLPLADAEFEWRAWRGHEADNDEFRPGAASVPDGAVRLDYANPGWVPLALDAGGNAAGVDLSPGPAGRVGQVINFGRDERRKVVLARGWGEFLTGYADLLDSGAVEVGNPLLRSWEEQVGMALGWRHPLDVLCEWRAAGRWPAC